MANIAEVGDSNFEAEVLKSDLPVLVDFWAPWCGPCKSIAPIIEEIASEYAGKLKVAKLNVDDHPATASRYGIRGIPNLIILKGGGDPTLSAAAPSKPTWYRGAARISDLADQVRKAGVAVTAVQVDASAFSGPTLAPGWDPLDIENGDIAPMESVMLDAGRTQPVSVDSRRSNTPALDAGRALAASFGVDPASVTFVSSRMITDRLLQPLRCTRPASPTAVFIR